MSETHRPEDLESFMEAMSEVAAQVRDLKLRDRHLRLELARTATGGISASLQPLDEAWQQLGDVVTAQAVTIEELRAERPLYRKIVDTEQIGPNLPADKPRLIEIVSDHEIVIHGNRIALADHTLYLFNRLITHRWLLTAGELRGEGWQGAEHWSFFGRQLNILEHLLNIQGKGSLFITEELYRRRYYGLHQAVHIVERREGHPEIELLIEEKTEPAESPPSQQPSPEERPDQAPPPPAASVDEPAPPETTPAGVEAYQQITAAARSLTLAEGAPPPPDTFEPSVSNASKQPLATVRQVLLISRINEALGRPIPKPEEISTLASIEQYTRILCVTMNGLLRAARMTHESSQRLSQAEATLIGLHLGLPPTIEELGRIKLGGHATVDYGALFKLTRKDGQSLQALSNLFKTSPEALEQAYQDALGKVKLRDGKAN